MVGDTFLARVERRGWPWDGRGRKGNEWRDQGRCSLPSKIAEFTETLSGSSTSRLDFTMMSEVLVKLSRPSYTTTSLPRLPSISARGTGHYQVSRSGREG